MAVIEVNHQALRDAATSINTFCLEQTKAMQRADAEIKAMLHSDWVGPDAQAFGGKWEAVDGANSTVALFQKSLENFAEVLNASAEAYRSAQEKAYNSANYLPRYFY